MKKYQDDDNNDKMNNQAKGLDKALKIVKEIKSTIIVCLLAVIVVAITNSYIARVVKVDGHSMDPNLANNEMLILNRLSYRFSEPSRFDIVVFPHDDKFYIKRIIGLPGETVQVKDGEFYINGSRLDEDYGNEPIVSYFYGRAKEPVKLGVDEYFCVGDNRNHSSDSRTKEVGNVKRDTLLGKATFRFYPFKRFGKVK